MTFYFYLFIDKNTIPWIFKKINKLSNYEAKKI